MAGILWALAILSNVSGETSRYAAAVGRFMLAGQPILAPLPLFGDLVGHGLEDRIDLLRDYCVSEGSDSMFVHPIGKPIIHSETLGWWDNPRSATNTAASVIALTPAERTFVKGPSENLRRIASVAVGVGNNPDP